MAARDSTARGQLEAPHWELFWTRPFVLLPSADFNWYSSTVINHNHGYNCFRNILREPLVNERTLGGPKLATGVRSEDGLVSCSSNTAEATGKIPADGQPSAMCTRRPNNLILGSFPIHRRQTSRPKIVTLHPLASLPGVSMSHTP
ncbi:hypothetical protein mRhiFer1_009442 [Rhinolophus ferrumequinum]|uniref:Uncharacterized protein n=1 Tax=Rhinolophus ferrumequinum TaxID=59479 RepID=A0A7J7RJ03_RHIFE|nr:hypothetical protein mRhiFer1_009442 [Rhinolophus ferrumequinum]